MESEPDPLGAFCPGARVEVAGARTGLLAALEFAAKDNFDVAGFASGAGNPDWLRTHEPARANAVAVTRLLSAGASLRGKTIMDELAFGALGQNRHYGTPLNPAAPGCVPGGSSSGSASAVAGGAVDFALGTDSACSVRLPAALCGLYGIRPTHGRVSLEGVVPLSPSLDTVGWLSRSADVMKRVGAVLLEPFDRVPRPTRVLYPEDAFGLAPPDVAQALTSAVARVEDCVGATERVELGEANTGRAVGRFLLRSATLQVQEVWACHGEWIESTRPDSEILNRENLQSGAEATAEQREQARSAWDEIQDWIRCRIPSGTLLVLPTTSGVAPRCGLSGPDYQSFTFPSLGLLSIAVLGGLPQVTIPAGELGGLPLGLSLVGERGSDEQLLEIASELR